MDHPFVLPDLPYADEALEPWCSAETLNLHHDKHHKAYVDGANAAWEELSSIDPDDKHRLAGVQSALTFNQAGHVLHSLFWENLAAEPSRPDQTLGGRIDEDFGGYDRFAALMTGTCVAVQGSGWGALTIDHLTGTLRVEGIEDHHHRHVPNASILAVIDVWEHAYYVDHRNDRPGWVAAALDHLDWSTVAGRLDAVRPALTAHR